MPKVSVIIPCYNRATLIGETIENLLVQTLPPHQIVVVDDGSTDSSVEVIRSFGSRVTLLRQQNYGPGAARNVGLDCVTGDYVELQDSDDLYSLNKLQAQAELLDRTQADIAFSPWVKVNIVDGSVRLENHVLQQAMPPSSVGLFDWWLRGWSTVFQSLMFRRSFLDRCGRYRTDMWAIDDAEFFSRMLARGPRIAFTDDCLTLYRLHSLNKITQDEGCPEARRIVQWADYLALVSGLMEKVDPPPTPLTRLQFRAFAWRHLGYLRTVPERPEALVRALEQQIASSPAWLLATVEFWRRSTGWLRQHCRGSRWIRPYQSGAITARQTDLIKEMGYKLAI